MRLNEGCEHGRAAKGCEGHLDELGAAPENDVVGQISCIADSLAFEFFMDVYVSINLRIRLAILCRAKVNLFSVQSLQNQRLIKFNCCKVVWGYVSKAS